MVLVPKMQIVGFSDKNNNRKLHVHFAKALSSSVDVFAFR